MKKFEAIITLVLFTCTIPILAGLIVDKDANDSEYPDPWIFTLVVYLEINLAICTIVIHVLLTLNDASQNKFFCLFSTIVAIFFTAFLGTSISGWLIYKELEAEHWDLYKKEYLFVLVLFMIINVSSLVSLVCFFFAIAFKILQKTIDDILHVNY